ncbi:major facilitator superfamily domain-containing protein [Clohesyomyces aquaticus]|uniref:Major facilitator superfamily domain-containing protein n=1 Tax=Clohesyomyces aquaticus TaxID=1231657 RepID=A0A1Y1ZES6_9PLEO|nr:major facilitator superfamily domain-containing protein [Clohesyomyces aquaticus]
MVFGKKKVEQSVQEVGEDVAPHARWTLGILADPLVDEVPGSIRLLSEEHDHHEPLGLHHEDQEKRASVFPSPYHPQVLEKVVEAEKRTKDGTIVLSPRPESTPNDPLNWSPARRNTDLLSLGLFCMLGGGMTPILAAGFNDVAKTFNVTVPKVALTTGLFMMGMGVGGALVTPTAILYGKRPVYLACCILLIATSVWCAASQSYGSLLVARIMQGIAVSPVEVLPSATIVEIFFLHERAGRIGIYEFLYLGGKNLIPLIAAAIVLSKGWRWVFWIVALVGGFCFVLLFFLVPESFWDRTPRPTKTVKASVAGAVRRLSITSSGRRKGSVSASVPTIMPPVEERPEEPTSKISKALGSTPLSSGDDTEDQIKTAASPEINGTQEKSPEVREENYRHLPHINFHISDHTHHRHFHIHHHSKHATPHEPHIDYTDYYREHAQRGYISSLKVWNGRLSPIPWWRVFLRPFVLFSYPSIAWAAGLYALSIGWLIVISESVSLIYRNKETYNFTSLQTGLVYISPFIGSILGTIGGGEVSDAIIKFMAKKNNGIYEPEFRLMMAVPVAITTVMGLMGFGWSAQERDAWIVPTVFFGIISFGCALGASTAVTFCVDSYRQYAGEGLVTLNFSKNVFHGLVFSFFVGNWIESDGPKQVYLIIGGIHLAFLILTIPMYIFGKRARMNTVRRNWLEKF